MSWGDKNKPNIFLLLKIPGEDTEVGKSTEVPFCPSSPTLAGSESPERSRAGRMEMERSAPEARTIPAPSRAKARQELGFHSTAAL